MGRTQITPAVSRKFRVLWYETKQARHILDPSSGLRRHMPSPKAKRVATFDVEARTLDRARSDAREYARRRGATVLCVNFTQRPNELILYTKESP